MILRIIQPTWGQAWDFAMKSGMTLHLVGGFAALLVAVLILFWSPKNAEGSGDKVTVGKWIGFGVFLVLAIAAVYFKPGNIRLENEFPLEEEKVSYYQGEKGDFQPFFDSLYAENRLKWAPNK